jgi:hypothetical protein
MRQRSKLVLVRRRLEGWREQYGGRGRPIPDGLWNMAVEVAGVEGVAATARALRVDRDRLARRVELARERERAALEPLRQASAGFIEFEAGGLCAPVRTVVRFEGRDGEKLELELAGVDVVALARAFWSRPG